MAKWTRDRVDSESLNGGNEFSRDSQVALEELNAIINAGLYSQDFVENLTEGVDISDANNSGIPMVGFVDYNKNGKVYKKFKFSNLKGVGIATHNRAIGENTKSTVLSWVGRKNDSWSGFTDLQGNVGDLIYIPYKLTDQNGATGFMVSKINSINGTSITADNLYFVYAPQGPKGDTGPKGEPGDLLTAGSVGTLIFNAPGNGLTFKTKDEVEYFI